MGRTRFLSARLTLAACLVWASAATAQVTSADLLGVVRDATGSVLPGVVISVTHLDSGQSWERVADTAGRYFLPSLPVGRYRVRAALAGFKTIDLPGVTLQVGQQIELPITLQIGEQSETVIVTGGAPLLDTTSAEVGDVIDSRRVEQLPMNGRQFLQLAQLSDGVVIPPGGTRGAALEQAGALPAVLGQRSGHNIYLLDGVKVTDEYFNNLVVSPSVDAIQEFKIQKTLYPVEFGGKASALINVVTRSGGNSLRGSAVGLVRHEAFDARGYFDDPSRPVPLLRQQQFGASLGGALARDRTFVFVNYEGQRLRRELTQTLSVPTVSWRQGAFTEPLCDPLTRTASDCSPFEGNQIPRGRMSPMALGLLARVPAPTSTAAVQNLTTTGIEDNPMHQATVRLDHRLSAVDTLFARVTAYAVRDVQPFGTGSLNETLVPGFGRLVTTRSVNVAVSHTRSFGSSVLNEVRVGWLRASGGQVSPNRGAAFADAVGLKGVTGVPADMGYPLVSFGGLLSPIGDPATFVSRRNTSLEVYDNVVVDRGAHHWKFGGYLFRLWFNPVNPTGARGQFGFTGQWTGNAFADFLLGYPSSAQVGIGRADEHGRTTWFHTYVQDDWKPTAAVTINYGLRYEINGQMTDRDNRLSAIDLAVPGGRFVIASDRSGAISPRARDLLPQIPIPYVTSAEAGWTRGLLRPSYRRFAPRVGLAWTLGADGRTVVSAGAGVFLNQWAYSVQQAFAQALPFFFAKSVNAAADALQPTFSSETMLLAPATGTVGGNTMNHDYRTEYAKNVTVGVQRQLGSATSVEVSYLGSWIVGADSSTVLNVPVPGPGPIAARRPVPQLSSINAIRWDGYSIFHALTLRVDQRLTRGVAMSANYSLSKAVDDASDPGATTYESNLPQDVRDMAAERALASFDHRHRAVANLSWDIPAWLPGALGRGWRVNGIATLQSGAPFTVNLGTDRANIGTGPAQRPDMSCDPNAHAPHSAAAWFETGCFSLPAPFTFGNAPRNSVRAPGYANLDAAVARTFALGGTSRLELRWEVFNALNRANFDVPNRIFGTANFGRIFSAGPARQMQVGARLSF